MPLLLHIPFIVVFGVVVYHYGHWCTWKGVSPDWFLLPTLYLMGRPSYPHLILLVAAFGLASDILSARGWASDTAFFVGTFLLLDRLKATDRMGKLWMYLLMVMLFSSFHLIWWNLWHGTHRLPQLLPHLALNTAAGLFAFACFRLIRLGWGIRGANDPYRILNA